MSRELVSIDGISHSASDFGNGSIEAYITVTGDIDVLLNIAIINHHDSLETDGATVADCTDQHERPVDYTDEEVGEWEAAIWGSAGVFEDYEKAVFAAQRERASEPDDGM